MKILGELQGVEIVPRYINDPHVLLQLLGEDDGIWHKQGNQFSAFWLDELIDVLQQAKTKLETSKKFKKTQWGYEYK